MQNDSTTPDVASSTQQDPDPDAYDPVHAAVALVSRYFRNYVVAVVIVFGVLGNVLSMVVFTVRRHKDRISATYLGPLALFDLANIGVSIHFWLISGAISTGGYVGSQHHSETRWGCMTLVYVHQYVVFLSGWTILLFTLERALVIHYPFRMAAVLSGRFRRRVLLGMLLSGLVINGLSLTAVPSLRGGVKFCRPDYDVPYLVFVIYYIVIIGVNMLVPCTVLVFLNIWILKGVYFPDQKVEKHQTNDSKSNKEDRLLRNLIAVSTCYFIFVSPIAVFAAIGLGTSLGATSPLVAELTNLAFYWMVLNNAVNPVLYTWSLPYYRRFVADMLRCRRGAEK